MFLHLLTALSFGTPTFEADVLPIFNAHCLQCHGGVHQRQGLDLRSHAALMQGSRNGDVVVAGKPEESLLWKKLHTDAMPKTDNKVAEKNKQIIRAWITAGAKATPRQAVRSLPARARPVSEVARRIDQQIDTTLREAKIPPSPRSSDAEYLRRISLDLTGKPPTPTAVTRFLASTEAEKRAETLEELLRSPEYGRNLAQRWIHLFSLTTVSTRPPDPEPFIDWMGKELNEGKRWNRILYDILTADGPLSEAPQGLFYYYNTDMNGQITPKIVAGNIAQVLLGVQLQCAECHNHPFTTHKQTDFWSLAAFFGQTARLESVENKMTRGVQERHLRPKPGKKVNPLKEISISIPNDGEARNGGRKVPAALPDGSKWTVEPMKSHRVPFAEWLTGRENRTFARATVNRLWAHFFGRGLVNPLNDFADHNAPTHPELLELLTDEFLASEFDHKHLIRCICTTQAYQRSMQVLPANRDERAEVLYARMGARGLTPEQYYDALCQALEVPDLVPPPDPKVKPRKPNPKAPPPPRARDLFTRAFRGPGEADEPTEWKLGVPHALKIMNESLFNEGGQLVARLMKEKTSPEQIVQGLYLAALSRLPDEKEATRMLKFVERRGATRETYARILWILINSSEFIVTP